MFALFLEASVRITAAAALIALLVGRPAHSVE